MFESRFGFAIGASCLLPGFRWLPLVANSADRAANSFCQAQSRGHSAYIGQNIVVHYPWHPLCGRSAGCVPTSGAPEEIANLELGRYRRGGFKPCAIV
jgi:hypothetical protein